MTGLTRRAALAAGLALLAGTPTLLGSAQRARAAESGPASRFMDQVAKDLFRAAREGSSRAFLRAINRHADVGAITEYSLGAYVSKISNQVRLRLRKGTAAFMARYFAIKAREYEIERAEITGEKVYDADKGEMLVSSRIHLRSGTSYTVDWLLAEQASRKAKTYKIRDVRILGFLWLGYYQKRLFVGHIDKNGGDIAALLSALRA